VFLFTDTQVVDESFLEDINNILSSGEVPNLYGPEDFEEVCIICCVYVYLIVYVVCQCGLYIVGVFMYICVASIVV